MEAEAFSSDHIILAAAPMVLSVYPEYLTDPNILVCPSDSTTTADAMKYKAPDPRAGQWALGDTVNPDYRNKADDSYAYFGWVFDRCNDEDPATGLAPFAGLTGTTVDANAQGPKQFVGAGITLLTSLLATPTIPASFALMDGDITLSDPWTGNGNAAGNSIYRLREGIERFLITDINNTASSAKSQSEIAVMSDYLSTKTDKFNHVPGGCNVLFMDGHVEFMKYPGKQPVSRNLAQSVGTLLGPLSES
jgi:prepilin-type processing-associated H-X9-DG protein